LSLRAWYLPRLGLWEGNGLGEQGGSWAAENGCWLQGRPPPHVTPVSQIVRNLA